MQTNSLKILSFILFVTISNICLSQNLNYAKKIVDTLASEHFYGRGYVNRADSIAADFLKKEFKNIGLQKFEESYFQYYNININTINENPVLLFGEQDLLPAKDFVIIPNSPDIDEWVKICWIDKITLTNYWRFNHFFNSDKSDCFICLDSTVMNNPELFKFANLVFGKNIVEAKGIIESTDRLKYTARTYLSDYIHIQIKPEKINFGADSVYIKISNKFYNDYQTQNIIGYLEGQSDSIIMITAHYDHLGMMGNIMFPGANDNASGVALVLDLANHYANKSELLNHNLVFVLFSGEEAGLLGSKYFADNPYFDLSLVKALINFDMVGTGEDGLAVFNAKEYPQYDILLAKINQEINLFENFRTSYAVYSSDHAPFHDKGVQAMFFYLAGNNENYHQPEDTFEDVSFYGYKDLFRLVEVFISEL